MEREYAELRISVQVDGVWLGAQDTSKWLSVVALLVPFGRSCSLGRQRYIELNPVRAAIVEDPAHYRWTSDCANGFGQVDARLTPHPLCQALGRSDNERQANDRALFRAQLDRAAVDDIRLAFNQSQPPGNTRFFAKIEQITGQRREARKAAFRIETEWGRAAGANEAAFLRVIEPGPFMWLNVSIKTVGAHREHVMAKLQIHSIAELTHFAIREGITSLETHLGKA